MKNELILARHTGQRKASAATRLGELLSQFGLDALGDTRFRLDRPGAASGTRLGIRRQPRARARPASSTGCARLPATRSRSQYLAAHEVAAAASRSPSRKAAAVALPAVEALDRQRHRRLERVQRLARFEVADRRRAGREMQTGSTLPLQCSPSPATAVVFALMASLAWAARPAELPPASSSRARLPVGWSDPALRFLLGPCWGRSRGRSPRPAIFS